MLWKVIRICEYLFSHYDDDYHKIRETRLSCRLCIYSIMFSYGILHGRWFRYNDIYFKIRGGGVLRKLTLLSGPIYYFHYVVILFFDVIGIERSSGKNLFIYIVLCILIAYVGMRVEKLERKGIKYLCSISKYNSD